MHKKRPSIPSIKVMKSSSIEETFQNEVVRPIIKMQHGLLIAFFRHYLSRKKFAFQNLSDQGKIDFISSTLKNDIHFRNEMRGMIIGHFSLEEYARYQPSHRELNKRIFNIVIQRLSDSLGELG